VHLRDECVRWLDDLYMMITSINHV